MGLQETVVAEFQTWSQNLPEFTLKIHEKPQRRQALPEADSNHAPQGQASMHDKSLLCQDSPSQTFLRPPVLRFEEWHSLVQLKESKVTINDWMDKGAYQMDRSLHFQAPAALPPACCTGGCVSKRAVSKRKIHAAAGNETPPYSPYVITFSKLT
jgi:hypothetical protein